MPILRLIAIAAVGLAARMPNAAATSCPPLPSSDHRSFDGGPVAETLMGPVTKVPAPRRHTPVPFGPLKSIRIRLDRSGCYGTCPAYFVELRGDGSAVYAGGFYVLVGGKHAFNIPPQSIQCLLEQFRTTDFWSLNSQYRAPISDNPTYIVTLAVGRHRKSVTDYVGRMVGMPPAVTALEEAIDRVGGDRWVQGNADTLPSLRHEHFDFHSKAAATMAANGAATAPDDFLLGLLGEGAPPTGRSTGLDPLSEGPTAVELASGAGRSTIVRALVAAGAFSEGHPGLKEVALRRGAGSGSPEVIAELLKYRPDVNAQDSDGNTALINIWEAQYSSPDKAKIDVAGVARLLLAAGADPSLHNVDGQTALHRAADANVVKLLVGAGAKLEARNNDGETPLLTADNDDAAMALIAAGADITAKAKDGGTVWSLATQYKYTKTLALLRARQEAK